MLLEVRVHVSLMLPALLPKTLLGPFIVCEKKPKLLSSYSSGSFRQPAPLSPSHTSSHRRDLAAASHSAWSLSLCLLVSKGVLALQIPALCVSFPKAPPLEQVVPL